MKDFPLVARDNLWLSCFNCYQDHYDFDFFKSKNPDSPGKYYMACDSCGYHTFFYFTEADNAENTN